MVMAYAVAHSLIRCPPLTGLLAVADSSNHVVRLIDMTSSGGAVVSTIAGQVGVAGSSDGAPASSALNAPHGIAFGPASGTLPYDVFWTETGSGVVRRYNGSWVSTFAGTPYGFGIVDGPATAASFGTSGPRGLAFHGTDLFVADSGGWLVRV